MLSTVMRSLVICVQWGRCMWWLSYYCCCRSDTVGLYFLLLYIHHSLHVYVHDILQTDACMLVQQIAAQVYVIYMSCVLIYSLCTFIHLLIVRHCVTSCSLIALLYILRLVAEKSYSMVSCSVFKIYCYSNFYVSVRAHLCIYTAWSWQGIFLLSINYCV